MRAAQARLGENERDGLAGQAATRCGAGRLLGLRRDARTRFGRLFVGLLRSDGGFGQLELLVLAQDRRLEVAQRGRRLDAELLRPDTPRLPVQLERLDLAGRPVQGQHQLRAQALSQRLLVDEPLELADELGVLAERQVGLDALLETREAGFLEAGRLGLGERLVREVGERRPAPGRAPGAAAFLPVLPGHAGERLVPSSARASNASRSHSPVSTRST